MITPALEGLAYTGRYTWVDLKRVLGIPLKSDKAHLCERIVRAAQRGDLHPDTSFTSGIRPDGLGAMILQRLSIQAAAQQLGFAYYHTPFGFVGHPETDPKEWSRFCEAEFDLGFGFPDAATCDFPYAEFFDYAVDRRAWERPHLVGFREMFRYCNRQPEVYAGLEWPAHYRRKISIGTSTSRRLAFHVRRGDVNHHETSRRYSANDVVLETIRSLTEKLAARDINHVVEIYSNGTSEELRDFEACGYRVFNEIGAIDTFRRLVTADCLVMAKSTFSYVAGLCSTGLVVYQPQDYARLDHWVALTPERHVDCEQLSARLSALGW